MLIDKAIKIVGKHNLQYLHGRIAFQQIAFLLQTIDEKQDYRFMNSVYGPYSIKLAEETADRLARDAKLDVFITESDFITTITQYHLELTATFVYYVKIIGVSETVAIQLILQDKRKRNALNKLTSAKCVEYQIKFLQATFERIKILLKNEMLFEEY